ncbi:MAG: right-handed parallel beta-helix repeat-containing protein [Ruminococcaceae bacterium]|nr:right-handed parallel beta-helix repeat-containing protein [Oscillospiraceae bacterium]
MKRIIALVLVLCMALGMVVSVSAAPSASFTRTLNLVRLIRTLFQKDEEEAPTVGELEDGILTVYVSAKGKSGADGTEKNPFGTITAARDAIRDLDKSDFDGITVLVKAGTYSITEPIVFTDEDSGTEDCPITYLGEKGAVVVGGVALSAKDFAPATGSATKYFPAEAKDKIVQIDVTKLGITTDDIAKWKAHSHLLADSSFLSVNGERQTLVRFPNEGFIHIEGGLNIDENGNHITEFTNATNLSHYVIEYGDEYFERVSSWSKDDTIFVIARWNVLWCPDDSHVLEFDKTSDKMNVKFNGGYGADKGGIFYFYNIPEELDMPGEYYFDNDGILYYYPTDVFNTATLSLPVSKELVTLDGVSYITFDGLKLTSSAGNAISGKNTTGISIQNCEISSIKNNAIIFKDINFDLTIQNNYIHDIGASAIDVMAGDKATVTDGNCRIYNNYVRQWSVTSAYGYGATVGGVGILVDHNTFTDANFKGPHIKGGVNITMEYNHVFDILNFTDDVGAVSGDGKDNANINVQYNYIHDIGAVEITKAIKAVNPDFKCFPSAAIYYDGMASYYTSTGNVVAGIYGNGVLLNAGRQNALYGNLFVDCAQTYIDAAGYGYLDTYFDENGNYKSKKKTTFADYVYTDAFKAINPEPATLVLTMAGADPYDPMVWLAPAFVKIQDNWCHFNKGIRLYSNWGMTPYYIDPAVWRYSNADEIDFPKDQIRGANENVSQYNSRREAVDIKKLITETASGVIAITWEQFETIGVVLEDWPHDVEIPEKTIIFEKGYEVK